MKIRDNWPFQRVRPEDGEAIADVIAAMDTELQAIQDTAATVQTQQRIETATSRELEKLGREVGVERKTGEPEARLRFRSQIAKAAARADGTIPEIAQLLTILFGDDATRLELTPVDSTPAIRIRMPTEVIDSVPLTQAELEDELSQMIPVSDRITIVTEDGFAFAGTDTGKGFDEGEWS